MAAITKAAMAKKLGKFDKAGFNIGRVHMRQTKLADAGAFAANQGTEEGK